VAGNIGGLSFLDVGESVERVNKHPRKMTSIFTSRYKSALPQRRGEGKAAERHCPVATLFRAQKRVAVESRSIRKYFYLLSIVLDS
jgi:hypothetical protein